MFFNFHHHQPHLKNGIYNLPLFAEPTEHLFSAGIHPQGILQNDEKKMRNWLEEVSQNKNCFAIGECGLDGLLETDKNVQKDIFLQQISLANKLQKPLIIHCVRMFSELIPLRKKSSLPMVIHGFNKKQNIAENLLRNNFYMSFGKAVFNNLSLQKTLEIVPLKRFFIETDDADFNIDELYEKVAQLKKITTSELQQIISENLEALKNG